MAPNNAPLFVSLPSSSASPSNPPDAPPHRLPPRKGQIYGVGLTPPPARLQVSVLITGERQQTVVFSDYQWKHVWVGVRVYCFWRLFKEHPISTQLEGT